jgi:hypothetical protein
VEGRNLNEKKLEIWRGSERMEGMEFWMGLRLEIWRGFREMLEIWRRLGEGLEIWKGREG